MTLRFALSLLVLSLASSSICAGQGPPESRAVGGKKKRVDPVLVAHTEAVGALKTQLAELAAWCEKMKLDRERAKVLELILVFDPDDAAARDGLGYARGKGGGWERSGKWKEPGNRDAEALVDFKKKRAEVGGAFLETMAKVIEENRRDIEPALRARIVGDMNAIDPNDPRTRRAGGEAQASGKWVLMETADGVARRKQLQAWAKQAIAAAGTPQPAQPEGEDNSFDIKWTAIVTTEHLRVMGTGSKDEINKIAVLCEAAGEFFGKVFDVEITHQTAYRVPIYVMADAGSKANMLLNNKGIKPEERSAIGSLGGTEVMGSHLVWPAEGVTRIDMAVRQMMQNFMGRSFGINGVDTGALYEGLGLHLTWYMTNTRLTWTVGKRKYAQSGPDPLENKLKGTEADWLSPGYELWSGKNRPTLRPLFAKHLNDLDAEDLLGSYMVAVWLIEGRKDDAPRFLRFAGRNQVEEGCREAFGLELNQLEDRLGRWAKENRGKN